MRVTVHGSPSWRRRMEEEALTSVPEEIIRHHSVLFSSLQLHQINQECFKIKYNIDTKINQEFPKHNFCLK